MSLSVNAVSHTAYSATVCLDNSYSDNNFTNLTQAGDYYDTLRNSNGCDSMIHLHLDVITVPVPTGLNVKQVDNRFSITWQGDVASYELYRNNTLHTMLDTTSFLDMNLVEGVSYCYKVKALGGDCESRLSEEVCLTFKHAGIAQQQTDKLSIYPNPTTGQLRKSKRMPVLRHQRKN